LADFFKALGGKIANDVDGPPKVHVNGAGTLLNEACWFVGEVATNPFWNLNALIDAHRLLITHARELVPGCTLDFSERVLHASLQAYLQEPSTSERLCPTWIDMTRYGRLVRKALREGRAAGIERPEGIDSVSSEWHGTHVNLGIDHETELGVRAMDCLTLLAPHLRKLCCERFGLPLYSRHGTPYHWAAPWRRPGYTLFGTVAGKRAHISSVPRLFPEKGKGRNYLPDECPTEIWLHLRPKKDGKKGKNRWIEIRYLPPMDTDQTRIFVSGLMRHFIGPMLHVLYSTLDVEHAVAWQRVFEAWSRETGGRVPASFPERAAWEKLMQGDPHLAA